MPPRCRRPSAEEPGREEKFLRGADGQAARIRKISRPTPAGDSDEGPRPSRVEGRWRSLWRSISPDADREKLDDPPPRAGRVVITQLPGGPAAGGPARALRRAWIYRVRVRFYRLVGFPTLAVPLFNALSASRSAGSPLPFCPIGRHSVVVPVPYDGSTISRRPASRETSPPRGVVDIAGWCARSTAKGWQHSSPTSAGDACSTCALLRSPPT